jgi:hypothetical protein
MPRFSASDLIDSVLAVRDQLFGRRSICSLRSDLACDKDQRQCQSDRSWINYYFQVHL